MFYDDAFKSRFPNTVDAINKILVHMRTFFVAEGLGTTFRLDVDPSYKSVGATRTANKQNLM